MRLEARIALDKALVLDLKVGTHAVVDSPDHAMSESFEMPMLISHLIHEISHARQKVIDLLGNVGIDHISTLEARSSRVYRAASSKVAPFSTMAFM